MLVNRVHNETVKYVLFMQLTLYAWRSRVRGVELNTAIKTPCQVSDQAARVVKELHE